MGVRGLWKFVEQTPGCSSKVAIEEAIRKAKTDGNGKSPLIIIDVASISMLNMYPAENLCGGRGQMHIKRITHFCDRLVAAGAQLAFVSDCNITHKIKSTWMMKRNSRYVDQQKIYADIGRGLGMDELVQKNPYIHTPVTGYSLLRPILRKFGPLLISVAESRDILIAQYAADHGAYAVLADGSDMLIFPSIKRVWPYNKLNFEEVMNDNEPLEVKETNTDALRKALDLQPGCEMALWATLIGNEFISIVYTKKFLPGGAQRYFAVRDYVKNLQSNNYDSFVPSLGRLLAKNAGDIHKKEEVSEAVRASLRFYRMEHYEPDNPLERKYEKLQQEDEFLHYAILVKRPLEITLVMEDQSDRTLTSYPKMAVEVYRRLIGVVLKHENLSNDTREIWTQIRPERKHQTIKVNPIYPDFDIPDITTLVFVADDDDDDDHALLDTRVRIMNFLFGMSWNVTSLTKNPKVASFRLALDVLDTKMQVKRSEVNVIWNCCSDLLKDKIPDDIEVPRRLHKRAVQIAFLFLSVYNLVNIVLRTIGLKKFVEVLPFDAVHFHKLYVSEMQP